MANNENDLQVVPNDRASEKSENTGSVSNSVDLTAASSNSSFSEMQKSNSKGSQDFLNSLNNFSIVDSGSGKSASKDSVGNNLKSDASEAQAKIGPDREATAKDSSSRDFASQLLDANKGNSISEKGSGESQIYSKAEAAKAEAERFSHSGSANTSQDGRLFGEPDIGDIKAAASAHAAVVGAQKAGDSNPSGQASGKPEVGSVHAAGAAHAAAVDAQKAGDANASGKVSGKPDVGSVHTAGAAHAAGVGAQKGSEASAKPANAPAYQSQGGFFRRRRG